ncbi:MAG: tRNA pseudouridine(55) synthase TruB [Deltaproteobacteria bacterium]|nr:tRNA pseudouridine(55) synthase TruB [Candidatus Zymogenaceae bacterium]
MREDGVVVIDKPSGLTSHDVVQKVKRTLGAKKVGHTGTLDPFATGVLVLGVNQGTKLIPYLDKTDKAYRGVIELGVATDTFDATGEIIERGDPTGITTEDVMRVLDTFTGEISQRPPMFSAVKVDGVRLYTLARKGVEVEVAERTVNITHIGMVSYLPPLITFEVTCSPGTYIRTLAVDIGRALGVCACLMELRRTRSGPFHIEAAHSLDEFASLGKKGWEHVIGLREAIGNMAEVSLTPSDAERVSQGGPLFREEIGTVSEGSTVKLVYEGRLLALGRVETRRKMKVNIRPFKVFHR